MRTTTLALALLVLAVPAAAQPHHAPPPHLPTTHDPAAQITQQLTDPATVERIANVMQSLTKAVLALRVGEIEAAAQGRVATPAEKRRTVRDVGRRNDPDFDRKFAEQMAKTGPMVEQSIKAVTQALPVMIQSLKQAGEAVERAAANMPDPSYPKR